MASSPKRACNLGDWRQRPLPRRLLDVELGAERVLPRYLTQRDEVWVEELRERILSLEGRPRQDLEAHLARGPGWGERPRAWRAMGALLMMQLAFDVRCPWRPAELRARVFRAAAKAGRRAALAGLSESLEGHPTPETIVAALYADRRAERCVRSVEPIAGLGLGALVERYNLALAQGLCCRAERLELRCDEQLKAILREARLRGLLALAENIDPPATTRTLAGRTRLLLSGPLALFRKTLRYGRALASWLPIVTVLRGAWRLTAWLRLDGDRRLRFELGPSDPIGSARRPLARFDSKVEARLYADLVASPAAEGWQVLREAEPVQLGRRIVCPDFVLVEDGGSRRVSVEIVGFWTEAYLRYKLALLRALPPSERWLLCVDESLAGDVRATLPELSVVSFRRFVDADALMARVLEQGRTHG